MGLKSRRLFTILVLVLSRLAIVVSVSQGYELGDANGRNIIAPLAVAQCEPALFFFNITTGDAVHLDFFPPDESLPFFTLTFPNGTGYLSWTCNIPAGNSFIASAEEEHLYTVQPGSSAACLGDLSTNTTVGTYATDIFQSFTGHAYTAGALAADQATINTYLPIPIPTITANSPSGVQPSSPSSSLPSSFSQGYQLGDPSRGIDILFPLSFTECSAAVIFYNISSDPTSVNLYPPDESIPFLTFKLPRGIGYVEWVCDIPAVASFIASALDEHLYTVQPGSSSECLGHPSGNTAVASYATGIFHSYTGEPYTKAVIGPDQATLDGHVPMPFPTITANSFSGISITITESSSSRSSSTNLPSSRRSSLSKGAIGGIVGGVGGILIAVAGLLGYFWLRNRRRRRHHVNGGRGGHDDAGFPLRSVQNDGRGDAHNLAIATTSLCNTCGFDTGGHGDGPALPIEVNRRRGGHDDPLCPVHNDGREDGPADDHAIETTSLCRTCALSACDHE